MITVVVKNSSMPQYIGRVIEDAMDEIPYEIVWVNTWSEGLEKSKGSFICFTDGTFSLSKDYFPQLLSLFQKGYYKLAMVGVATGVMGGGKIQYGYHLESGKLIPTFKKPSNEPYAAQIVLIPGALIRKTALVGLSSDDPLEESANLSLALWATGNRCLLNPMVQYYSAKIPQKESSLRETNGLEGVLKIFKREMVI